MSKRGLERMEIAIPKTTAEKYKRYCEAEEKKINELLQEMIIKCIPHLHNTENLGRLIVNTKNGSNCSGSLQKFRVQLPDEAVQEIHTYCNFFKLNRYKSCFLYYLIEEELLKHLEALDNGR